MPEGMTVYERLAERFSSTPNGLPRTRSGVELRLLARMFSAEQAALAAAMHLYREEPEVIAERAGVDAAAARETLKGMARRGLVYAGRGERSLTYGLLPFVVGSFEESLPYFDTEMAQLFEEMVQESRGVGMLDQVPAVHRVIPVEQSVSAEIEVLPYEAASKLLESATSFGIRECICRKQRSLIGHPCQHERFNCIAFSERPGAFDSSVNERAVSREDAFRILREAEEEGLVHSVSNHQAGHFYICNCCTCCCGIARGLVEFGQHHALAKSGFLSTVDAALCSGCGSCVERCPFDALSVVDDVCEVDEVRCMGCGLCSVACPTEALVLTRRKQGELAKPPLDSNDWMAQRANSRGLRVEDLI